MSEDRHSHDAAFRPATGGEFPTQMHNDAESRWLLHALAYVFAIAFVVLAVCWIACDLPTEKVGNGYQLLGLLIAALAIPILPPALARVEFRVDAGKDAAARWLAATRVGLRRLWARIRRRPRVPVGANLQTFADIAPRQTFAKVSADYSGMTTDQLARRALDEVGWLRKDVRALEKARDTDRQETQRKIDALRTELQQHVLSVTREGWHFVVAGATVTAGGIIITLFA